ncbi:MAG: sugar transferase [Thiothrix sp.]|nr:sugar transferase [Thiothrix sp.]
MKPLHYSSDKNLQVENIEAPARQSSRQPGQSQSKWLLKRLLDLLVSVAVGLLVLPIIGICVGLIWLISPGPVFFSHERVGYQGKLIRVWKLRTMHVDSARLLEAHLAKSPAAKTEWEQFFKLRDDPRIVPWIGNFLRKSSIDELPQLLNIISGDMSLVGPRPFPKYHLDAFSKEFQSLRQQVVPGLTGLWQVSARSDGDISIQEKLDRQYIEQHSLWLDTKILLKTVHVVLARKGAC